jgi:hypothetical protein
MAKIKKQSHEDRFFPVAVIPRLNQPAKPAENPAVIKKIIQGAIQGAFQLKTPSDYDIEYRKITKPLVSEEQIQFVTHLIESLEPANAIEAALASQFAITYIRGLQRAQGQYPNDLEATIQLFEFGHTVLEALQRYRTKGAQLINVQYNHNQAQFNNFNLAKEEQPTTIEV